MARKNRDLSKETSLITEFPVPAFPVAQPDLDASELSDLARCFWAKSGDSNTWLSVVQHLMDTADIAAKLFDCYLSEHHRNLMASVWEGDQAKARASFIYLSSIHDVGKISCGFSCQRQDLAQLIRHQGLTVLRKQDYPDRKYLRHELVSQFAFQEEVMSSGGEGSRARHWAILLGVHHGRYPDAQAIKLAREQYNTREGSREDDPRWGRARSEILRWMARRSGFPLIAPQTALPELPIAVASAYASALVIADWLASNEDYFPLRPRPVDTEGHLSIDEYPEFTAEEQRRRVQEAWERADFPAPMRVPDLSELDVEELYRHRFGWPASYRATKAQRAALEIVSAEDPDLMIVEAAPGSGKTELALASAEALMRARGLQGIFVALPTQATTNAMFSRVKSWLTNILGDQPQKLGIQLAHGKRSLNESFMELIDKGRSPLEVYDGDDDNGLYASTWMGQRWRSTLSPVVVGTIDQILLAALKSRHVLVRHLGLMGKVVVIDEVHASDEFMSTYLDAALTWLGMYGIPVVLLSATLPPQRRMVLLNAYRRGKGLSALSEQSIEDVVGYPVISTLSARGFQIHQVEGEPEVEKRIIPLQVDSPEKIAGFLDRELADGGCAVIIRNTVREAQETYDAVKAVFGREQTTLLHARFLAVEREERDRRMLELFGKNSAHRPQRHVVVSTQVVEQSLDVDFDLMLTDPAPMDLVLQRIGRLHRHNRQDRQGNLNDARCFVLVNDLSAVPWGYSHGTDSVYSRYLTLRTLGALCDEGEIVVREPIDYARLTSAAYANPESTPLGPKEWQEDFADAWKVDQQNRAQAKEKARAWCLEEENLPSWKAPKLEEKFQGNAATGEGTSGPAVAATRAAVRDGEDQIPVLVVAMDPEQGNIPLAPPISGRREDDQRLAVEEYNAHGRVREMCTWSISLPPWAFRTRGEELEQTIDAVAQEIWDDPITKEWECRQHPLLSGELILAMCRSFDGRRITREIHGHTITYSIEKGMEVQG